MKTFSKFLILMTSIVLLLVGMLTNIFAQDIKDDGYKRCIVQLNDTVDKDKVTGLAKAFSVRANASIKHVYKHSIKGFTINTPCHAAHAVFGDNEFVKSMEADAIITISAPPPGKGPNKDKDPDPDTGESTQEVSYGTTRVGGGSNAGTAAWVIDTGVDLDHPDLNVDVSLSESFLRRGGPDDGHGHGTHVAGIIGAIDNNIGTLGVAPNTSIVAVRVLDKRGSGTVSGVIAGVDYVAKKALPGHCANMSLGGGISTSLDEAVKEAAKGGIIFTLAAGNESDHANNHSPARAEGPNIYTIAALEEGDGFAYYSNYGIPPIDYIAPGSDIISLWKNGGTRTISGTSMAAPHACAVLMLGAPSTDGFVDYNQPYPIIHTGN